jgi:nitrogenase subunit NifH
MHARVIARLKGTAKRAAAEQKCFRGTMDNQYESHSSKEAVSDYHAAAAAPLIYAVPWEQYTCSYQPTDYHAAACMLPFLTD